MKIKIGDVWYDEKDQPIMVELTDFDKKNIASMHKDGTKYCAYDGDVHNPNDIREWMEQ